MRDGSLVPGDSVRCLVWELLSIYDREGIIMSMDNDECVVMFETKTLRINKNFLKKL